MKTGIRLGALCAAMVVLASLAATACGSDSGTGDTKDKNTAKGGATGAGGAPAGSAPCGSTHCEAPEGSDLMPCCKDPFAASCGVLVGTNCTDPPKPPPPGCPMLPPFMGLTFSACCTTDGQCGVDTTMLGQGCIDLTTALMLAKQMGMEIMNPPSPASCTP